MNIFDYILAPFIFIIEKIFLFSSQLTENYGWAIVLLSLGISLLLLPIFIYIEKAKRKDDALKLRMKPVADEIKRVYKGQERFYYLKTLNRQFNYSPFRALIPILTLLVQIPFFIAAYLYLENLQALKGVSFLFIPDLSQPDGLLGPINILPIAMTVVNLVTAWFYTRYGDKKERWQMVVVAGVFLIMLFNLPSGLVLYWTMNNVFSFFRLFVTNPEVFKKSKQKKQKASLLTKTKDSWHWLFPKLKTTFYVLSVVLLLGQLNWAFQHSFNDIFLRIGGALLASLVFTFFIGLITTIHHIPTKIEWKPKPMVQTLWPHFKPFFIILSTIAILSQLNWALHFNFNTIVQRIILAIVGSALITFLFALIVLFYQNKIKTRTFIQQVKQTPWPQSFKIALAILTITAVFSQINWALQFNFNDIVPRVIAALFGSWLIMYCALNIYRYYKNLSVEKISQIKTDIQEQWKKLKWFYIILTIAAVGSQLNWALHFNFDDIALRIVGAILGSGLIVFATAIILVLKESIRKFFQTIYIKPLYYYLLLLSTLYFYLSGLFYFTEPNNSLYTIASIILIPTEFIAIIYFIRYGKRMNKSLFQFLIFVWFFLIFIQTVQLIASQKSTPLDFTLLNSNFSTQSQTIGHFVSAGLLLSLLSLPFYHKYHHKKIQIPHNKSHSFLFIAAVFYIAGFIFLWNPIHVFSSSPDSFSFTSYDILKNNSGLFFWTLFGSIIAYLAFPRHIKRIFLFIILFVAFVVFLNSSIFPLDLGTLQSHRFFHAERLALPTYSYLLELGILLIVFFILRYLLLNGKTSYLLISIIVLNLIPLLQSTINTTKNHQINEQKRPQPLHSSHSISFSRDQKNVAYIVVDMVQGWYLRSYLAEDSVFKNAFDGFTWYPNTVSISNYTTASSPSIMGGYNFTPDKLNQDTVHLLGEKIVSAHETIRDKAREKGFHFTSSGIPYGRIDKNNLDSYLPLWHKDWDFLKGTLKIGSTTEQGYSLLWQNALFYSAPTFIKPKIYNKGAWMFPKTETNENNELTKHYNFLRVLPYISDTLGTKPIYALIWINASHFPWDIINENGELIRDVTPYENQKWTLDKVIEWLNWMKKNKVYDNTKIVILSDHGIRPPEVNDTIMIENPFIPKVNNKVPMMELLYFTPLLMVKDYHEKGEIKEDWRFMSNIDGSSISLSENDPTKAKPPLNRTLESFLVSWRVHIDKKFVPIDKRYRVQKNVYHLKNWERIE